MQLVVCVLLGAVVVGLPGAAYGAGLPPAFIGANLGPSGSWSKGAGPWDSVGNYVFVDADPGMWAGAQTISYQWYECDAQGSNCVAIPDYTTEGFQLNSADLGHTFFADVIATNESGSSDYVSNLTGIVGSPTNTSEPAIGGSLGAVGDVVSADPGVWTNSPSSYAYAWFRCAQSGADPCSAIPGATSSTYQLTGSDVGDYLAVQVTGANGYGASYAPALVDSAVVGPPAAVPGLIPSSDPPSWSGDVTAAGDVLTADPGVWSNAPTSYGYQWYRCDQAFSGCAAISGATARTYTLQTADLGSELYVAASAANSFGAAAAQHTEQANTIVGAPVEQDAPSITGSPDAAGNNLTVDAGQWTGFPSFTYQWHRCDSPFVGCVVIPSATFSSYVLAAADLGRWLYVTISATNQYGTTVDSVNANTGDYNVGAPAGGVGDHQRQCRAGRSDRERDTGILVQRAVIVCLPVVPLDPSAPTIPTTPDCAPIGGAARRVIRPRVVTSVTPSTPQLPGRTATAPARQLWLAGLGGARSLSPTTVDKRYRAVGQT